MATEVKDISKTILFECKSCFRLQEVPQESFNISEPALCQECGETKFKIISIETTESIERTIMENVNKQSEKAETPKTTTKQTAKKTEKAKTK